jgi:aminotransferase
MSAPTTAQEAAIIALEQGEEDIEEMRQRYDRRRRLIVDGFNTIGLKCFEPRGAFYAFPSVRGSGMDDAEFAERLLDEERVAVIPGRAFGIGGAGYVRCSYATAYTKIEQALDRIANFVRRHG